MAGDVLAPVVGGAINIAVYSVVVLGANKLFRRFTSN